MLTRPAGDSPQIRVEQLLGMIPAMVKDVGEIRRLLSDRRKDYYTIDEFAEIVRRAPYTIRTWVKDGRVGAIRVSEDWSSWSPPDPT